MLVRLFLRAYKKAAYKKATARGSKSWVRCPLKQSTPQFDQAMAVPTEHVFQNGSYYTRKIECTWLLDTGPSYAEYGVAPLQLCPKARENIEELLSLIHI